MRLLGLLAWMSLLVVGCSEAVGPLAPTPGSEAPSLDGRVFISQEVTGRDLVEGTEIRLSFDDGNLGAMAGCNSMGAGYSIEDGRLVVDAGGLSMTEIGCDPERHEQDTWLADFLLSSPSLDLAGDELSLRFEGVWILLDDREVAEPDRPLVGPTWVVDTVFDQHSGTSWDASDAGLAASAPTGVTIDFPDEETFVVSAADCTSATGQVEIGVDSLTFADFVVEDIACPRPWAETLEVLGAGETTYEIEASRLTIEAGGIGIGAVAD